MTASVFDRALGAPDHTQVAGRTPGGAGVDGQFYGLLRLARTDVALPLSALREVVPCPDELALLPTAAPGLLGAMSLRTMVLPVVDLRPLIGRTAARGTDEVVVVVAHGGRLLGLLADEVVGDVRLPDASLMPVSTGDGPLLFSHTFLQPGSGRVTSVLDAGALLALPGVPTLQDSALGTAEAPGQPDSSAAPARTFTLVQAGPYRLAFDIAALHTTLLSSAARPSVLSSLLCRGVIEFADKEVPVVDPLVLLGLEPLPDEDTGTGLVLDLGHGYVVLAASALLDITRLGADDILPLPASAVPRPGLLAGVAELDDKQLCLVLDNTTLLASPELVGLASVNTDGTTGRTAGQTAVASVGSTVDQSTSAITGPAYLTYVAGFDVATPLTQIAEIFPLPELTPTLAGGSVLGVVVHRREAVPVLCLAQLLGRPSGPLDASTCVLLVAVDDQHVAFTVDALHGIQPRTWADPDSQTDGPGTADILHAAPLVQLAGQSRLLPALDLQSLARRTLGIENPTGDIPPQGGSTALIAAAR